MSEAHSNGAVAPRMTVVLGNVTPPGRLDRAVGEASDRAGAATSVLRLGELDIGWADGSEPSGHAALATSELEGADAVIFATPIYRGSLSAALKNLLDWTPVPALRSTAVGIVAMGASPHHYLGADRHLRDLMTFFGARVAPVSVYLDSSDFDSDGRPSGVVERELDELFAGVAALASQAPAESLRGPAPLTENERQLARR